MIPLNSKLPHTSTSIFAVMSQLATQVGAINLSQGFPDYDCSPELIELVNKSMKSGNNQYAPMPGLMSLRECVATKVNDLHSADYNPESEITITAGATQAIFTAIAALIQPNDEVIIFEPAYDCYAPTVRLFGGLVKAMELAPPDYRINWDTVKKLMTANTRMIILNTPNNPTGTVLNEYDINQLTSITKGTDILILSDEVYEHLIYDGKPHLSLAKYAALKERTFVIASFGKLLHTTGWKLGYCLAPAWLTTEFRKIHQFVVFSVNTPMQHAIACFLSNKENYQHLPEFFRQKRDLFREMMQQTRFDLLPCYGSYFQCVQYGRISKEKDTEFARRLTTEYGVTAIPISAFYNRATDYSVLRFCFAKKQETLEKAVKCLVKV